MAKRFTLEILMNLAKAIGANPSKFMGTRTNITFLGKGPTKNPLFQGPVAGLEGASEAQLGSKDSIIGAVEDAMGFASAQKLNSIQIQALGINLENILKVYKPPVLPSASITPIAPGIEGLRRFPKESHRFFGRPLKGKDFSEIDQMMIEGKIPDARGRRWDFKPKTIQGGKEWTDKSGQKWIRDEKGVPIQITEGLGKYRLWKAAADVKRGLPQKTASARATLYRLLDMSATKEGSGLTLREIMSKQDLKWLLEGGGGAEGDPIAMFAKYYGNASANQLPTATTPAIIAKFAKQVIRRKDRMGRRIDDPYFSKEDLDFAGGGLAHILQVPRSGYSKGRLVKSALAILNKNKKNAKYMFNASDNVSPGYAAGDMKYNAELLADQLAEDAGVVYADLGDLERTKFYGTAYDYLAKEMGQVLSQKKMMNKLLAEVDESMTRQALYQWKPGKGRKPSASGGLAGILEV